MKKITAILLCIILTTALCACGQKETENNAPVSDSGETTEGQDKEEPEETEETDEQSGTEKEDYSFAVIVPTTGNEYFQGEIDALQATMDEYGYPLNVISYDMNADKQVSSVENLVTMNVDAALVFPMDKESIDSACRTAMDGGVKIISGGIELDNMDALYNTDQKEAGNTIAGMACDYIKETYGDESVEVAMLINTSNSNMVTRCDAMKETLEKECPNAVLVKEIEAVDTETGMNAAENVIQANPDVKVFICVNDTVALGVVEAYKAANISDIAVFGSDGTSEGIKKIANGDSLKGTIAFGSLTLGDYLLKLAKGEEVEELISPPIIRITEENVADYVTE